MAVGADGRAQGGRGGAGRLLGRLWRERRGVAAVEFALIAPVLIGLYFLSMEVSQAVETSKKVSRAGAMIGDLVTQLSAVTTTDLDAIMQIGSAVLQPYQRTSPTVTVTGIRITTDDPPKVLVSWSRSMSGPAASSTTKDPTFSGGAAKDSATTVPTKLLIPGSFLVRVESRLSYSPVITWSASSKKPLGLTTAFDGINMGGTYYLRPRMTDTIACTDC